MDLSTKLFVLLFLMVAMIALDVPSVVDEYTEGIIQAVEQELSNTTSPPELEQYTTIKGGLMQTPKLE